MGRAVPVALEVHGVRTTVDPETKGPGGAFP